MLQPLRLTGFEPAVYPLWPSQMALGASVHPDRPESISYHGSG
jgi:hypothetical protein